MTWSDDLHDELVAAAGRRRAARVRRAGARVACAAAVVALGAGVTLAAAQGGSSSGGGAAGTAPRTTTTVPDRRDPVVVAVFNGTAQPGLARNVASRLAARGAILSNVSNAPETTSARTRVYATRTHVDEAHALVDGALHLPFATVSPLEPERALRALAPGANVIVVAGPDAVRPAPVQHTVALTAVGGGHATGTVRWTRDGVVLRATGLAPGNRYGVWLGGHFLGFAPPARAGKPLEASSAVAQPHGVLLVTREASDRPGAHPGEVVLRAELR
jgi:hypothetical protein